MGEQPNGARFVDHVVNAAIIEDVEILRAFQIISIYTFPFLLMSHSKQRETYQSQG
jgi:hypothetical protein